MNARAHRPKQRRPHLAQEYRELGDHDTATELERGLAGHLTLSPWRHELGLTRLEAR